METDEIEDSAAASEMGQQPPALFEKVSALRAAGQFRGKSRLAEFIYGDGTLGALPFKRYDTSTAIWRSYVSSRCAPQAESFVVSSHLGDRSLGRIRQSDFFDAGANAQSIFSILV